MSSYLFDMEHIPYKFSGDGDKGRLWMGSESLQNNILSYDLPLPKPLIYHCSLGCGIIIQF